MSKFNVASKYVAATPRSQRRKGAGVSSAPSSGVAVSGIDKNALAQYMDLISPQDVEGLKNFVNGLLVASKLIYYDADNDALVIPTNLIVEKEVAWNSTLEGFDVPTIMDAIQVDGVHIKKDKGYLEFVGEVGGGIDESQLGDYLTRNNYAKKSDIPSLSGYATESWVTGRGYITGINGSMVIAALGYTPYNSANFTKATIKSTLDISDWALASVKPSYSWSEIGSRPTALSQFSNDSGFITNNVTGDFSASGMVRGNYLSTGYIQISSNIDASLRTSIFGDAGNHWGQIKAFRTGGSASYGSLAGGYAAGILFAMNDTHGFIQLPESSGKAGEAVIGGGTGENIKWSAKLLHSLNYSSYALPITGGTISGNLSVTGTLDVGSTITGRSKVHISAPDVSSNYAYMSVETMKDNRALCRIVSNYQASETTAINIYRSSVGIGKAYTADEMYNNQKTMALHITGNTVCTGEISWNSSRVLKDVVGTRFLSLNELKKLKPYNYYWKDKRDKKLHAGAVADYVLPVLPEVILTDSNNIHSMDYGQGAWVVGTSLVPIVDKLISRVKELEDLVTKLLNKYGDL